MKSIANDIRTLLIGGAVGSATPTADWSIHVGTEPDKPDKAITVYDTGGEQTGYYMDNNLAPTRYDTFQVRVRGRTYTETFEKLSGILDLLDQNCHFQLAGLTAGDPVTEYGGIFLIGQPASLQKDDKGRSLWVANFRAVRETKH
jgi:hypothetical protein